ncbi:MAG TPA: NAD(P)-dependent oxidoreductase [Nocardioides sp.]|uniref:NAD(P)-dependent oxidoreductase n=1 Tax=Nocardioides sp. TaxID=35761 RepID=UPI002E373DC1|nr:NAD(P)-dependent oxidoreductase [Nocardioides sp.]HEX3932356.1 NAD(P)-dependent oxidoreductase [Nocardioides sp.]
MTVVAVQDHKLAEALGPVPGVEVVVWPEGDDLPPRHDEVELVVPDYLRARRTARMLARLPRLRAVQLQTAGYDGLADLVPAGLDLLSARGVHDDATAELALGLTIASLRGIDDAVRENGQWRQEVERRSLADSLVAILGYGSIGRAIAERMLACRAQVTGVATTGRDDPVVGRVVTPGEIDWAAQHVVVVVLPLTESTRYFVDATFLARLRDETLVVNVGRGPLLDTDAVLAEAGRLRFALDVTDPEPLPDGHRLWAAPGVLITPHIAGGTTAMLPRMAALLRDQLERLRDDRPLRNVVTR